METTTGNKESLYDLQRLTEFRHDIHMHPELAFQEVRTSTKIAQYLLSLGVPQEKIRKVATTGLIVDIEGTGTPSGKPFCVALRADMDALPIKEENPSIPYKSITEAAHMCGHDMHVACLLGGISKILEKKALIPSDKTVRLLFQPAEEAIGGALPMIKEGAMEGVNEVYGFHVESWDMPGKFYVLPGYVMACCTEIDITITGKGGHVQLVNTDEVNDPLIPASQIQLAIKKLSKEYLDKGEKFALAVPYIRTGNARNAINEICEMKGTLRTFGEDFLKEIQERLRIIIEETCREHNCRVELKMESGYPALSNSEKETENVKRVARKVFGEENMSQGDLPQYGGEDFAYFSIERPGAYFFLSAARSNNAVPHSNNFDANDDVIPLASETWFRLIEDRFDLTF